MHSNYNRNICVLCMVVVGVHAVNSNARLMKYFKHECHKFQRSVFDVHNPKTSPINRITNQYISERLDINKINHVCPEHFQFSTVLAATFMCAAVTEFYFFSHCETRHTVIPISSPKFAEHCVWFSLRFDWCAFYMKLEKIYHALT